jgi:hypothetical protein
LDRDAECVALDRTQLSALGHGLYALLSRMSGYQAAQVGWDPEGLIDLAELRHEWSDELARGEIPGLALSTAVRESLQRTAGFQRFSPGYDWIPYRGEDRGNRP